MSILKKYYTMGGCGTIINPPVMPASFLGTPGSSSGTLTRQLLVNAYCGRETILAQLFGSLLPE